MTSAILSAGFNGVQFDVVDRNNQPWLQSRQIATALGYKDESSVRKIFERNKEEFTSSMTATVKMTVGKTPVAVRIFSLRGCHLLAMFSRTPVAKAFRVWVLDVLDKLNNTVDHSKTGHRVTTSTPSDRVPLRALVHAWSQTSGLPHSALWPQVKAHFQLSNINDLPLDWLPDALSFVQGKIDSITTKALIPTAYAVPGLSPKTDIGEFRELAFASFMLSNKIADQLRHDFTIYSLSTGKTALSRAMNSMLNKFVMMQQLNLQCLEEAHAASSEIIKIMSDEGGKAC